MRINKNKVALVMFKKGIVNQKALAELAKLNTNTLSLLMRGADSKIATICKLAEALGVDITEITEDN